MKYAVRYYTKSGNTKRLADAIAGDCEFRICCSFEFNV